MHDARVLRFSADYPGALAALLEKETGAPCLFLQGAAGDLSTNPGPARGPEPFGQALGRDLPFEEIPREIAKQFILEGTGFEEDVVETMLTLQEASVGHDAWVSPQVEAILGRPALPFAQWAADHVADFS